MSIDLHIHSTASDGTLTPAEIIAHARHLGLTAVAITDHDTVDGVRQVLPAIPDTLHFLTGVELSTAAPPGFPCRGSVHLLGYGFRPDDPQLDRRLRELQAARRDRNPQIIDRLRALGIDISMEELTATDDRQQAGRPHIARLLLEKGVVASFDEAFDRYLGSGRPAYVDKYRIGIREAIGLIREAGGIAVLAHPALIVPRRAWRLEDLVGELRSHGLDGMEAHYPEHTPSQTRHLLELARRHDLVVSGGTDFHGAIKPQIEMGSAEGDFRVPFEVYADIAARLRVRGTFL